MKKYLILIVSMYISLSANGQTGAPQIGDVAPSFTAKSTKGIINFPTNFTGKWVIFFSHPADFTPVCKTEFKRLADLVTEFEKIHTKLIGLSVDPEYVHKIWEQSLEKELAKEGKPSSKINFPVIGDADRSIAKKYGMIHPKESTKQTVRSVYFIDPKGIIRAIFYYPISNGRNFIEVKRLLQALQISNEKKVATPENWQPGQETISKEVLTKDLLPEQKKRILSKAKKVRMK